MRYHCLFRSRMAKADVLRRVLERKVSDGQWEVGDAAQKLTGVQSVNMLRDAYQRGVSVSDLLGTPGLTVFYHEENGCHVVEIDSTHFLHPGVHWLSQELPANERAWSETSIG